MSHPLNGAPWPLFSVEGYSDLLGCVGCLGVLLLLGLGALLGWWLL